jgi:predicted alpha/beta hydrolase
MESLSLAAADGYPLAAHLFSPNETPRATVVVPAAMGVRQDFYFAFAGWLRDQGFEVLTFDYRGVGRSAPRSLRGFEADLVDWATKDYEAALRWARKSSIDRKIFVVGHSLGGQLPGIVPEAERIDGIVTIASGSGYWRDNVAALRRWVWLFWFVIVPFYTRLFGYFPGRRLRKVGDVPKGAINQWRDWCLDKDYLVGALGESGRRGFARIACPMLSLSFTDDEMMSETNVRKLHEFYVNATLEMRRLSPLEVGVPRIGHFGFFRSSFRSTLWPQVEDWLAKELATAR